MPSSVSRAPWIAALLVVSCAEPAPPPPSLSPFPSTARPLPLCGDAAASTIRALLPDLPPCADGIDLEYALARTDHGMLVSVAYRDPREAAVDGPVDYGVVTRLDGAPVEEGHEHFVPETDVDRDALLSAAILEAHGGPGLVFDEAELSAPTRTWIGAPLGPSVVDGHPHLAAYGRRSEVTMAGVQGSAARYDAVLEEDGALHVDETLVSITRNGATAVPWLDDRPHLEPTMGPRPLCGAPEEDEIRARADFSLPCSDSLTAVYVATDTTSGRTLALAWSDPSTGGAGRGVHTVVGDTITTEATALSGRTGPGEEASLLHAALLAAHGGPEIATDVTTLETLLPPPERALVSAEELGLFRDERDDHDVWLVGVGLARTLTGQHLVRYEVRQAPNGPAVTRTEIFSDLHGVRTIPALAALPPLTRSERLTRVCGSPREAAIRARVSALPACSRTNDASYLVVLAGEPILVVAFTDEGTRRAVVVHGTTLDWRMPEIPEPATPADTELLLTGAILAAHRGSELAFDATSATRLAPGAPLESVTWGRTTDPPGDEPNAGTERLSAIGVRTTATEREVLHYHATFDRHHLVHVYRATLLHERDGAPLPVDPTLVELPSTGDPPP